jgi:predicted TIM-barrel enzyme
VNREVLVICHGRADAERTTRRSCSPARAAGVVGFYGASSMERLPNRAGDRDQARRFADLRLGSDVRAGRRG